MSTACRTLHHDLMEENKQGISSILGLSGDGHSEKRLKTEFPLRRTLSADMSSKRFIALHHDHQHSSSYVKKVPSSEEISIISGPSESDEDEDSRPSQFDVWRSIQSQKPNLQFGNSPPYVHPLVRRSSSSLSTKSLELCTESLGSETGSDCTTEKSPPWFSFSPPPFLSSSSEKEEQEGEEEEEEEGRSFLPNNEGDQKVAKHEHNREKSVNYNCSISRRSPSRSFPPPLPSISRRDGPCFHVKPHRQDGRLVLEAIAVPSHNYLHAERQGGRLLLSFISTLDQKGVPPYFHSEEAEDVEDEEDGEEEKTKEEEIVDDERGENSLEEEGGEEEQEEEVELGVVSLEEKWRSKGPAVLELHRSIGKIISQPFVNMNPWTQKSVLVEREAGDKENALVGASMTQRLNVYEYCWKAGAPVEGKLVGKLRAAALPPLMNPDVVREATGLAPRRCNKPSRPHYLCILQRYCVATT